MGPESMNPLAELGQAVATHGIAHAYAGHAKEALAVVGPALAVGLCCAGVAAFRATAAAGEWAFRYPQRYRNLYRPWIGPGAVVAGAIGVGLAAPGYIRGMEILRPESWPNWGTLSGPTAFTFVGVSTLGLVFGGATMLSRWNHDGKDYGLGRACAKWGRWVDVQCHSQWGWTIPMAVNYRGSQKMWGMFGAGKVAFSPSDKTRSRHVLLVGQTGSGKGYCVFGPIIASSKIPIIYQDVKGQLPGFDMLKERFGKEPLRWGCAAQDGWPSLRWNPLEECRRDPKPEDAFAALAAALIPEREGNDWVSQLSRPILSWVFAKGGFQTMGDLQDALINEGVDAVLAKTEVPRGLILALEGKNVKEYLGTTIFSAMACFGRGWGRESTDGHDFSLEDFCTTGGYVLSAEPEVSQRAPIVVFWRLLLRKLLRSSKPVPLTLAFDEALMAGKIPSVRDALATLRDREVSIIFGTQHLSGLKEVYGMAEGESLIASFTSRIFLLNGLDPRDREHLVQALGKRTVKDATGGGKGAQTRHVEVPLLTLDDLNRRASIEGAFWAVLEGAGVTRTGYPVVARLLGTPKNLQLIRRPSSEEIAAEVARCSEAAPQAQSWVTPGVEEQEKSVLGTLPEDDLVAVPYGAVLAHIMERHNEVFAVHGLTGKVPVKFLREAMAEQKARTVNPDEPSDDYLPPLDDEPLLHDSLSDTVGTLPEDF